MHKKKAKTKVKKISQKFDHAEGDVNQICGENVNVTINKTEAPARGGKKKWWELWGAWVGIAAATIGLVIAIIKFPGEIQKSVAPATITSTVADSVKFEGIVFDTSGTALAGVTVTIDLLPGKNTVTTTEGGFFFGKVPGKPGDRVRIYASHPVYKPCDLYFPLPGPARIFLEKK